MTAVSSVAYDAFGHLITATGTAAEVHNYYYDAGGTRVGKQLHGEDPVFSFHIGFDRLEDFDTGTTDVISYVYEPGIDRPLAMIDATGDITFFHQDVLGNVAALTNGTGALVEQYRYEVWGKPQVFDANNQQLTTNNPASPFLFTAREYDAETGLYHYRARAYSPELGRFLQFDPIDFWGGDGNMLRYVENSALLKSDPKGHKSGYQGPFAPGTLCTAGNCRPTEDCPLRGLPESGPPWGSIPPPGECMEADAVASSLTTIKIPNGFTCIIQCGSDGQPNGRIECFSRSGIPFLPRPGVVPPDHFGPPAFPK